VAGVVEEEGALAVVVVELEVEQAAVALVGVVPEREVPEQAVAAVLGLALVQPQGQALARVREPQSVLDLMHP